MTSWDIFHIDLTESRCFSIRHYPHDLGFHLGWWWRRGVYGNILGLGWRKLGSDWSRFAIDIGRYSLVFENYKVVSR